MKKQTKLSLNKFKIAKISKFEQGKVVGGQTNTNGDDDLTTTRTKDAAKSTSIADAKTDCINDQMPD